MEVKRPLLLLGGTGFVGRHLRHRFESAGTWQVMAPTSADCDLTDSRAVGYLARIGSPDTSVVFCSTISRLRDDSLGAFHRNVRMAEHVVRALQASGYRNLVFCSSIDVYGRPPSESPITEASPLKPAGYYGHAKLVSEFMLTTELRDAAGVAILRLPGIYSLEENDTSALGTIFNTVRQGRTVTLSGGGRQRRTFLNVSSLVDAIEAILERQWTGIVNVADAECRSLADMVLMAKEHLCSAAAVVEAPPNGSEFDVEISVAALARELPTIRMKSLEDHLRARIRGE